MIERSRVRVRAAAAGECSSVHTSFCVDSFGLPFHPRVIAVARKRSVILTEVQVVGYS